MRNFHKSILSFVLILAMLVCVIPVSATETQYIEPVYATYNNPLYDNVTVDVNDVSGYPVVLMSDEAEYYTDVEDAAAFLRQAMTYRIANVQLQFKMPVDSATTPINTALAVLNTAFEHTGVPTEGDYLHYQVGNIEYGASGYSMGNVYYLTFSYQMSFYTDYDMESEIDEVVEAFVTGNIRSGMTDYEKFRIIYDWICDNVVYDHDNLEDESYMLKYTAYAAMIHGTSVCQGYANLLYRMLLEVSIDNRIISGYGITNDGGGPHAWNIVKLGGLYYDVDATWDASWHQSGVEYEWCLKNEAEFGVDHIRDDEFTTDEYNAQYPMATSDYDPNTAAEEVSGYQALTSDTYVNWSLTGDVYMDLAGYDMTGTIALNGYQIYGMDSTTDKYTCDAMGTFNCVDASGAEIVPARHWKGTEEQIGSIKRYMTIDTEDGYTFHRFYLGITHIYMKPSDEDVGFKAVVAGDEMVFAQLDPELALGHSMHLGDENTVTLYHGKDELRSGRPHRLGIDHFDIDHNSEVTLYAKVMLTLTDGTVISTDEVSMTVRSMLEQLNNKYTSLILSQLQSIREMLARHPIVQQWGLDKLLGLS